MKLQKGKRYIYCGQAKVHRGKIFECLDVDGDTATFSWFGIICRFASSGTNIFGVRIWKETEEEILARPVKKVVQWK